MFTAALEDLWWPTSANLRPKTGYTTPHRHFADTTTTPHYFSTCSVVSQLRNKMWRGCGVGVV